MSQCSMNVQLGRLHLKNPILVASGTFGYAREMQDYVDFSKIAGVIPKTVTPLPRQGNPPPRTIETASGMLNSIGLDNDGLDVFLTKHMEYLSGIESSLIVNIAGKNESEFCQMAEKLNQIDGVDALELNISCPNVSGGVDYGTNPEMAASVVSSVRKACDLPVIAKLTPNVTQIVPIAQAVKEAEADAVSLVNTFLGMAIDWKKRKPILGNRLGGLSGPAIKPLALRIVYQVAQSIEIPIIGIGGIATVDDVMEFLVAGASAVQIGTANFYDPSVSASIADQLPRLLSERNYSSVTEFIGSIE